MKKNKTNKPLFSGKHTVNMHADFELGKICYYAKGNPEVIQALMFSLATKEPEFAVALLKAARDFMDWRIENRGNV